MTKQWGRGVAAALATAVLAVVLAGCGAKSATPPTTSTQTVTSTAPITTTTNPAAPNQCSTGVLEASATFGGTAAGQSYYTVSVKNTGPSPCEIDGYPSYKFLGPSGAGGAGAGTTVNVSINHGGPAPTVLTVSPGASADSIVVYSDVASGSSACPQIASALLTPPGSSESLSFPISFAPCGGLSVDAFGVSGSESP